MILISDLMNRLNSEVWSHDKPIDFCLQVIEDMFEENLRTFTVYKEAEQYMLEHGITNDRERLLLECLQGKGDWVFLSHLTEEQKEEYNERLKNKVAFEDILE
jgi:hypothetical protein